MTLEFSMVREANSTLKLALLDKAVACASIAAKLAADIDEDGAFPSEEIDLLGQYDLLTAPLPTRLGGVGLGSNADWLSETCNVLGIIGGASLPLGRLYEGHVNAVVLAMRYGSPRVQEALAEEALAGRISAVWMAGASMRLEHLGHRRYRLQGKKILCSGAGYVRRPIVAAELPDDGGSMMVLADTRQASAESSVWTPLGMRPTATGTVDFSDLYLDEADMIGVPGDYLRSPYFQGGAWRVLAVQLGGLQAIMTHYRNQLADSPHADHPLQLERFGEATIAAETARLWVVAAARSAEGPFDDPQAADAYINLARNAFERAALIVMAAAQKAIGLKAFLRPNPIERIVRDLSTYLRQPALDPSLLSAASFHLASSRRPMRV